MIMTSRSANLRCVWNERAGAERRIPMTDYEAADNEVSENVPALRVWAMNGERAGCKVC